MAVPTMSNNTPAPGSITWGAFSIQYLGVVYSIGSGSTSQRWVWWRYNGGSSVIEAGADIPVNLTDDDLVLFGNKNGIGVRIQSTSYVDGELLVDGSIFAEALSTNLINSQHIVTAGLDAGVIKFGTMSGDRISADTITGSHIKAGTITAVNIGAGEITAVKLGVGAVTADAIDAGVITGKMLSSSVILGSTISTGVLDKDGKIVGARVDLGPAGLTNTDANGDPVIVLPTDDVDSAYLRAHVEMLSADVLDNFSMFGTNNQIARNGKLMLSQGVVPPTSPPTVTYSYDQIQFDTTKAYPPHDPSFGNLGTFALNPSQITSITWDRDWQCWYVLQQLPNGARAWRFNTDGTVRNNYDTGRPWVDDLMTWVMASTEFGSGPVDGPTHGNSILGRFNNIWYISTPWGNINVIPTSWITDTRPPQLGFDHVAKQWFIAQSNGGGSGTYTIRRFNVNNGLNADGSYKTATSVSLTTFEASSGLASRTNGVAYAPTTAAGSNRYLVSVDSYATVYAFTAAGVALDDDGTYECWPKDTGGVAFAWDGARFATVDASGKLTFYESWNWPEISNNAWVAASAYDSDAASPGGTHETPVSVPVLFTQRRRAKLVITMPETADSGLPDDPDKWKLYYAKQVAAPTAAQLKYIDQIGSPTARTSKILNTPPTGGPPPGGIFGQVGAVNTFPNTNPARLVSTATDVLGNPIIDLTGDGSGRVGPISWDIAGKALTGIDDTGWVNFNVTAGDGTFFPGTGKNYAMYRKFGPLVHVRVSKDMAATRDLSTNASGDFGNLNVLGDNSIPASVRPPGGVLGTARMGADSPVQVSVTQTGSVVWVGGLPRNYNTVGVTLQADFVYLLP